MADVPVAAKEEPKAESKPATKGREKKSRYTGYRLFDRTEIAIQKRHHERLDQAFTSREIGQALFGRKRFRNIVLTCTLNNFYHALLIANTFHRRVPGLHMIISLESIHFTMFENEEDKEGKAN